MQASITDNELAKTTDAELAKAVEEKYRGNEKIDIDAAIANEQDPRRKAMFEEAKALGEMTNEQIQAMTEDEKKAYVVRVRKFYSDFGDLLPKPKQTEETGKPKQESGLDRRMRLLNSEFYLDNDEKKFVRDLVYITGDGNVWSPLLKYPKNLQCFCGSGIKFKKCCINGVPKTCSKEDEPKLKMIVEQAQRGIVPRIQVTKPEPEDEQHQENLQHEPTTTDINADSEPVRTVEA